MMGWINSPKGLAQFYKNKGQNMDILRTPDECFENLFEYDFEAHYTNLTAADGTSLRMHYVDEGEGELILCLHGQPSWSYLYRKMIPLLVAAGYRVIAPDLIGFGKSDKPAARENYSYDAHTDWLQQFIANLELTHINLVCQDWGGLIGLRIAGLNPDLFSRLIIANTALPDNKTVTAEIATMMTEAYPHVPVPSARDVGAKFVEGAADAFLYWVKFCGEQESFTPRDVFLQLSNIDDERVLDGYSAPFPNADYIAGARQFPSLVPLMAHHQADRDRNDLAWKGLETFERPVLTAFANDDPVMKNGEIAFQKRIPGAKNIPHVTIENAGHFLQETQPQALSDAIIQFIQSTA